MTGRLLVALVLLASGLVIGIPSPAAACSCVEDRPVRLARTATVAFVGELVAQRSDPFIVAQRFRVATVHQGEVHRTQDVVTPSEGSAACGVEWTTGTRMVVLGYVDGEQLLAANACTGALPDNDAAYDEVLAALGPGTDPLAGSSVVELSPRRDDLRWFSLAVGVIGLAALGVLVRRRLR